MVKNNNYLSLITDHFFAQLSAAPLRSAALSSYFTLTIYTKLFTLPSSGDPFKFKIDLYSISRLKAFDLFFMIRNGKYSLGDKMVVIGGSSIGNRKSLFNIVYNYLQNKQVIGGSNTNHKRIYEDIKILTSGKQKYIYAYPSVLRTYIEKLLRLNINSNKGIEAIFTTSENLHNNDRVYIEKYLNAKVFDLYGARDGGIVADQCILQQGYHQNMLDCVVETVPFNNTQINELVLTNLNAYNYPFIRYKIGDLATTITEDKCGCGLSYPRINTLSGRTREIIKFRDGTFIHGSLINKILLKYSEIIKYQVCFSDQTIELNIISDSLSFTKITSIKNELQKYLPKYINLKCISNGKFKYTKAGKFSIITNMSEESELSEI